MLFSSNPFLFFFLPIVLLLYYGIFRHIKNITPRNILLLVVSLFFYGWGERYFVFVLMGSIIMNWAFGLLVDKYRENKKAAYFIITLSCIFNLAIIFVGKYLVFTLTNVNALFKSAIPVPDIALPIGISFFTFQALSYVIDVYRQNGEAQKNPLNVGLYITFFPQLIAGPIVRYETVAYQINHRVETIDDFSKGVCRFIVGLGKKVLIANNMAIIADAVFGTTEMALATAWMGAFAYAFQIYFDFSGYSDMAIGLGQMFGFKFEENFDYPYISTSATEFWRRWHISLGTWFRDYVYFPLGGSRVESKMRHVFNLFVVWFLTGVWHGANWTFIVWGLYYFVVLVIEKMCFGDYIKNIKKKPVYMRAFSHVLTLFIVLIGWVVFRVNSLGEFGNYLQSMFCNPVITDDMFNGYFRDKIVIFLLAVVFSMPVAPVINRLCSKNKALSVIKSAVYPVAVTVLFLTAAAYIVKGSYNPFIYFNF
ncbi:MAG: MBOAT family protein [Ruminococcaceae bacterium]|nr:MBOAT family protein [Oscillospiraceae bacterium]